MSRLWLAAALLALSSFPASAELHKISVEIEAGSGSTWFFTTHSPGPEDHTNLFPRNPRVLYKMVCPQNLPLGVGNDDGVRFDDSGKFLSIETDANPNIDLSACKRRRIVCPDPKGSWVADADTSGKSAVCIKYPSRLIVMTSDGKRPKHKRKAAVWSQSQ